MRRGRKRKWFTSWWEQSHKTWRIECKERSYNLLIFTVSTTVNLVQKNQLLRFQNRVTIQIVYKVCHFYTLPTSAHSHTLLQTIISIQSVPYQIQERGLYQVNVGSWYNIGLLNTQIVYYVCYFYIFYADYVWYYHLFCVRLLICSSEISFIHYQIHSHNLPFLQVIVVSVSQTPSTNC